MIGKKGEANGKRGIPVRKHAARRVMRGGSMLLLLLVMVAGAIGLSGCGSSRTGSTADSAGAAQTSASADTATSNMSSQASAAPAEKAAAGSSHAAADSGMTAVDQYGGAASDAKAAATAADSSNSAGNSGTDVSATDAYSRKVVYQAKVTMEVKDYAQAQTQIRNMVQLAGGYILQFSDSNTQYERGGNFTLKIPAEGFFGFVDRLKTLDPKLQQNLQGQDVTEEYVDLSSRLKAKQVQEERLLAFMEKATKADDLVQFSNQLSSVQEQIEQIKGRMRYINQNVAYSTVDLRVYQNIEKKENEKTDETLSFPDQVQKAFSTSSHGVVVFLQGVVIFLCYALPIAFFLLLFTSPIWYVLIKRWRGGSKKQPPSEGA